MHTVHTVYWCLPPGNSKVDFFVSGWLKCNHETMLVIFPLRKINNLTDNHCKNCMYVCIGTIEREREYSVQAKLWYVSHEHQFTRTCSTCMYAGHAPYM